MSLGNPPIKMTDASLSGIFNSFFNIIISIPTKINEIAVIYKKSTSIFFIIITHPGFYLGVIEVIILTYLMIM